MASIGASATRTAVDLNDIQALLRYGLKQHSESCFLLLQIKDRDQARTWLANAPLLSSVAADPLPTTVLQIALTAPGLLALHVADDIVQGFSHEFVAGMSTNANRAQRLGDIGANDPTAWQWGGPSALPHVLVMLYAMPGHLAQFAQAITAQCAAGFELQQTLTTTDRRGVEPFGFADGIAQPQLDWPRARAIEDRDLIDYTNLSCLGEFVLGYPNEYGRYTDRPLFSGSRDGTDLLPRAEDAPGAADLGRNGSYLVLRQLQQDVPGFWRFLDERAAGDATRRQQLAEAMVGRRMSGEPLVPPSSKPIPGTTAANQTKNGFTYAGDPDGVHCPFGAHIRRSNPRNADLPSGVTGIITRLIRIFGFNRTALRQDIVASTRFHRLLRRGRAYGPAHSIAQAITGLSPAASTAASLDTLADSPTAKETGLHFICLNANIARQFEFVQGAWQMSTKFNGMRDETDPLLGNRSPVDGLASVDTFSVQEANGPDLRVSGLPQFVTVVGGAYFFLPGIRALRFLVSGSAQAISESTQSLAQAQG